MKFHHDIEEVLFSNEDITNKCQELGRIITEDYQDKNPVLVGLLKGCIPFMAELIKHIELYLELDFMDVSSYIGTESTGKLVFEKDLSTDIRNRHVLIVDDIIDTGLTLKEVCVIA